MRVATQLQLRGGDKEKLTRMATSRAVDAGLARRARIVLLAAEGMPHTEVAKRTGVSVPVVREWRARYEAGGIRALADLPRSGRPKTVDETRIVLATLERPPERLGVPHWSSRLLARELGISSASIIEAWRRWDLQPWRRRSFKFPTEPQLAAGLTDIVALYLNPPDNAVVVCVDEKSQVQALDRTRPIVPIRPGPAEKAAHDYIWHSTATLFAALEIATGKVADACYTRHRHQEFLKFLNQVAAAFPGRDLHVVCDNYATRRHQKVRAWLTENPRVTLHFTPAGCSWPTMVEVFFGIVARQVIRRGTFISVKDLTAKIGRFIDGWNDCRQPFAWIKTERNFPRSALAIKWLTKLVVVTLKIGS
jgi:transposase